MAFESRLVNVEQNPIQLNMRILNPSRKKVRPGDIFCFQIIDDRFHFGRVIRVDAKIGGWENVILVYFYRTTSEVKTQIPVLSKSDLLIPPIGTNHKAWRTGYFETVANTPLSRDDVLPVHCFYSLLQGAYYDENGLRLAHRTDPCGTFVLDSFATIDDALSDALEIPRCMASREYDAELKKKQEESKARHAENIQRLAKNPKTAEILRKYGVIKDET